MRLGASVLILAAALLPATASADPLLNSDDIVRFFAGSGELGSGRGVCVGTEDECGKKKKQAPSGKTGLDMNIDFAIDSAELGADQRIRLGEFAKALKDGRLSSLDFAVESYTDASGPASYNQELSGWRAQSVTAFLSANGVEASRLSAIGMGETHPRGADPYDRSNSRVEMRIKAR